MNVLKTAMLLLWISWVACSVVIQELSGWWGLAIYLIGSTLYAVWSMLLARRIK